MESLPSFSESATKHQLVYKKEDGLSLATDRRNDELLRSKLNIVDVMEEGDKVGVFYNFIPTTQFTWRSSYENTMHKVKRNLPTDRNKFGLSYGLKMALGIVSSIVDDIGEVLGGSKKDKNTQFALLEGALERLNGGKKASGSTVKKGAATVLNTQIVVMSESADKLRQHNNARSLSQAFETITDDNRLAPKALRKSFKFTDYSISGAEINKIGDEEAQNFISIAGRDILERYNFIDKVETQETQVPEDLRKGTMRIGYNTYRGVNQQAYLSSDREYKQLMLILIGPTRAGKSTLIGNLSYDALNNGECVVLFDFIKNCELSEEVSALFPKEKILNIECHDFETLQGLGYNEIPPSKDTFVRYTNAKKQTTQITTLVNSINTDDTALSARMNRYLTSAALVVFISGGSIKDVFGVLQQHKLRAEFLQKVPKDQYENMEEYIGYMRELDDRDKEGNVQGTKLHLVEGIISRLNKLKDNPYMELMLKKGTENNINLVEELQKNQIICIKMPETMFSTDNERDMYTTYWMTKIYLALQVRSVMIKDRDQQRKVNLVIDELYQVENTEILLKQRLSRMAKFGMKPIISAHYLNQIKHIREELRSANASYMLISGCDKKNFEELKSELYPFTEEDLLRLPRYHSMNLIKNKDGYGRFITKLPAPVGTDCKVIEEK
ncbi:type IV secretion system DNA-binding domain-containing protein [Peribacillus asahii]|uniref:type IV secretion system DNA-binding domain-containing protein n=1 Tax=Peribacillus asahii TaxID=228899 RepID=UPI00380A6784